MLYKWGFSSIAHQLFDLMPKRDYICFETAIVILRTNWVNKLLVSTMFLRQISNASLRFCSPSRRCFNSNGNLDFAIAELNKEMESIFGEPPSNSHPSSLNPPNSQESHLSPKSSETEQGLTHVNSNGEAKMVDISAKEDTKRVAVAGCRVLLGEKAFNLVAANQIAKGDVLNVAKLAGIMGAKQTSNLIPLCHTICLTHVELNLKLNKKDFTVEIEGEASTTGKTGVEMEAMTAVTVAGLTVYDMCKAASKEITITDVCLKHKSGGKSGRWSRS